MVLRVPHGRARTPRATAIEHPLAGKQARQRDLSHLFAPRYFSVYLGCFRSGVLPARSGIKGALSELSSAIGVISRCPTPR